MRQRSNSSFRAAQSDDIDHAKSVGVLQSTNHGPHFGLVKTGSETWSCAWSPDGLYFAWSSGNRKVHLVPWNQSKQCLVRDDPYDTEGRRCDQPARVLDCGDYVWSLDIGTGHSYPSRKGQSSLWRRFSFSDEIILAVGLQKGHIKLWDCRTGQLLMELLDHKDIVRNLHFAPDHSLLLVSASRDGTLKLWDLNDDGNMMKTLRGDAKWVNGCAWSPDATMLAGVGNFKSVIIWDMKLKTIVRKLVGHLHDVSACKFSPDGALLATASFDTRVIIWDPYIGDILLQLHHLYPPPSPIFAGGANDHYVRGLSVSCDGLHLSTVAEDGRKKSEFPAIIIVAS
ncbi:WD repeat and SOCS box-containing protein 1-like isoform X2 [Liolophura sinensis]|uniref:WD repeat and SOCS box-containing protein 1-like isoform X2 n=1 Tax=Liolophura sinensis TaxID=3198878 RepID=UPI0031595754